MYLLEDLLTTLLGNGLLKVIVNIVMLFVFFEVVLYFFYPVAIDSLNLMTLFPDLLDSMIHMRKRAV